MPGASAWTRPCRAERLVRRVGASGATLAAGHGETQRARRENQRCRRTQGQGPPDRSSCGLARCVRAARGSSHRRYLQQGRGEARLVRHTIRTRPLRPFGTLLRSAQPIGSLHSRWVERHCRRSQFEAPGDRSAPVVHPAKGSRRGRRVLPSFRHLARRTRRRDPRGVVSISLYGGDSFLFGGRRSAMSRRGLAVQLTGRGRPSRCSSRRR